MNTSSYFLSFVPWGFCAAFAVIAPLSLAAYGAASLRRARDEGSSAESGSRMWVMAAVVLTISSYVLIAPPTLSCKPWAEALVGNVFNTVDIILFKGSQDGFVSMTHDALGYGAFATFYAILIELYVLAVPFVVSVTALGVFVSNLTYWKVRWACRHKREIFVFNGITPETEALATDIGRRARSERAALIFCGVSKEKRNENSALIQRLRKAERFSTIYTPEPIDVLPIDDNTERDVHYFILSKSSDANVSAAIRLLDVLKRRLVEEDAAAQSYLRALEGGQGDASDEALAQAIESIMKRARRIHLCCLHGGDEDDLVFDSMYEDVDSMKRGSNVPEVELMRATLRNTARGNIVLNLVSEVEEKVDLLLEEHPLTDVLDIQAIDLSRYPLPGSSQKLTVVVVGLGSTGSEVVRRVFWQGRICGVELRIVGIDKGANAIRSRLEYLYPEMMEETLPDGTPTVTLVEGDVFTRDVERLFDESGDAAIPADSALYCVVALKEDTDCLSAGLGIRRALERARGLRADGERRFPPLIALNIKDERLRGAVDCLRNGDEHFSLVPFGSTSELYSCLNLVENRKVLLAAQVAAAYEEASRLDEVLGRGGERKDAPLDFGITVSRSKVFVSFNEFEIKKASNIALAKFAPTYLTLLGFGLSYEHCSMAAGAEATRAWLSALGLDSRSAVPMLLNVSFADYEDYQRVGSEHPVLWNLAEMEHARWLAFYRSQGWSGVSVEELRSHWRAGTIPRPGNHQSSKLRLHCCMCDMRTLLKREGELNSDPENPRHNKDFVRYDRLIIIELQRALSGLALDEPFVDASVRSLGE